MKHLNNQKIIILKIKNGNGLIVFNKKKVYKILRNGENEEKKWYLSGSGTFFDAI